MSEEAMQTVERIASIIDSVQPPQKEMLIMQAASYVEGMAAMANFERQAKQDAEKR